MTKRCNKCNQVLPLSMYGPHKGTKDKLTTYCKTCINTQTKRSYSKKDLGSIKVINYDRKPLNYTDHRVEEGKQFATRKDFIAFKRKKLRNQEDKI